MTIIISENGTPIISNFNSNSECYEACFLPGTKVISMRDYSWTRNPDGSPIIGEIVEMKDDPAYLSGLGVKFGPTDNPTWGWEEGSLEEV